MNERLYILHLVGPSCDPSFGSLLGPVWSMSWSIVVDHLYGLRHVTCSYIIAFVYVSHNHPALSSDYCRSPVSCHVSPASWLCS